MKLGRFKDDWLKRPKHLPVFGCCGRICFRNWHNIMVIVRSRLSQAWFLTPFCAFSLLQGGIGRSAACFLLRLEVTAEQLHSILVNS